MIIIWLLVFVIGIPVIWILGFIFTLYKLAGSSLKEMRNRLKDNQEPLPYHIIVFSVWWIAWYLEIRDGTFFKALINKWH